MQTNGYDRYLITNYKTENEFESGLSAQNSTYYQTFKRKYKTRKGITFTALIILTILLVGLAVFLIQTSEKKVEFYFIQAGVYLNYREALSLAQELQAKQGAGYVYYDGSYHILISFYPEKADAESVLNNLKVDYPNASVLTLSETAFKKNSSFTADENDAIYDLITNNNTFIRQTYNQLLLLDKSEISASVLQSNLRKISDDFEKNYENFKKNLKNNANFTLFNKILYEILESYKNLCEITKNEFQPYELKYELIKVVCNHVSFLSAL